MANQVYHNPAWLYQRLNHEAKAWPYHVGNRAKQRESIKRDLEHIRDALRTKGAHVTVGHGGNTLKAEGRDGNQWTLSGFGPYDVETFRRCGIPVINYTTANFGKLCDLICHGPMVAVGERDHNNLGPLYGCEAFGLTTLAEHVRKAKAIGATVHNDRSS
jgi:hypothetical protein